MPLLTERSDGADDVGPGVPVGQAVEQSEALGGEEFDELGAVHPATLALRTGGWHSRCTSAKSPLDSL